jgi:hypothetical protein
MIKKVRFKGEEYWLAPSDFAEFNLSPLEHFNESGEMLANPFHDISYAVVENGGKIMRYGEQIGHISELEEVK